MGGVGYGSVGEEEDGGKGRRETAVQDAGKGPARGDEWNRWVHAVAVRRREIAFGVLCGLYGLSVGSGEGKSAHLPNQQHGVPDPHQRQKCHEELHRARREYSGGRRGLGGARHSWDSLRVDQAVRQCGGDIAEVLERCVRCQPFSDTTWRIAHSL